eukprot:PhM_4_TR13578/c0_g1_i2/m.90260
MTEGRSGRRAEGGSRTSRRRGGRNRSGGGAGSGGKKEAGSSSASSRRKRGGDRRGVSSAGRAVRSQHVPRYRSNYVLGESDVSVLVDELHANDITAIRLFNLSKTRKGQQQLGGLMADADLNAVSDAMFSNESVRVITLYRLGFSAEAFTALVHSLYDHPAIHGLSLIECPGVDEDVLSEIWDLIKYNPNLIHVAVERCRDTAATTKDEEADARCHRLLDDIAEAVETNAANAAEELCTQQPEGKAPAVCPYFKVGVCEFGSLCRNLHVGGEPEWMKRQREAEANGSATKDKKPAAAATTNAENGKANSASSSSRVSAVAMARAAQPKLSLRPIRSGGADATTSGNDSTSRPFGKAASKLSTGDIMSVSALAVAVSVFLVTLRSQMK